MSSPINKNSVDKIFESGSKSAQELKLSEKLKSSYISRKAVTLLINEVKDKTVAVTRNSEGELVWTVAGKKNSPDGEPKKIIFDQAKGYNFLDKIWHRLKMVFSSRYRTELQTSIDKITNAYTEMQNTLKNPVLPELNKENQNTLKNPVLPELNKENIEQLNTTPSLAEEKIRNQLEEKKKLLEEKELELKNTKLAKNFLYAALLRSLEESKDSGLKEELMEEENLTDESLPAYLDACSKDTFARDNFEKITGINYIHIYVGQYKEPTIELLSKKIKEITEEIVVLQNELNQ